MAALKDQGGAAASGRWLDDRGLGAYSPCRRSTKAMVTEPIKIGHYIKVTVARRCLRCPSRIRMRRNPTTGGVFWGCTDCGWYISWNRKADRGYQVRLDP